MNGIDGDGEEEGKDQKPSAAIQYLPPAEPAASLFFLHENETFPFHLRASSKTKVKRAESFRLVKNPFESVLIGRLREGEGRDQGRRLFHFLRSLGTRTKHGKRTSRIEN